jgi:peroxiredoxin
MTFLTIGLVLSWLLVAAGCWLAYQVLRQNGRILTRLDQLEQRVGQLQAVSAPQPALRPEPLPLGSVAPGFELPDLGGARRSLADYRGRRLLLVFFSPQCGYCVQMAPELSVLCRDDSAALLPLVVTTGNRSQNRQFMSEHGIRCPVLLQEQMEVAAAYRVTGTPIGYLIDEDGRIASEMAIGAPALLSLAAQTQAPPSNGKKAHRGNRILADSKLTRDGLKVGTPAPQFTLPRLSSGEVSLADYRGRRLLLVFSDPHCGPCSALAPSLEEIHNTRSDVDVLMITRGDRQENLAKVAELKLTLPVVLQKQWEISLSYGMFATPIGYLIDERGVIVRDVAVGADAILGLLTGDTEPSRRVDSPDSGKEAIAHSS